MIHATQTRNTERAFSEGSFAVLKHWLKGCILTNKSKQVRGLPFDAVLPPETKREDFRSAFKALREEAADVPEMSLEEINSEISAARSKRKRG